MAAHLRPRDRLPGMCLARGLTRHGGGESR
jgi:hypothetical protein